MTKKDRILIASLTVLATGVLIPTIVVPSAMIKPVNKPNQNTGTPSTPDKPNPTPDTPKPTPPDNNGGGVVPPVKPEQTLAKYNLNLIASTNDLNLHYDPILQTITDSTDQEVNNSLTNALKSAYLAIEKYTNIFLDHLKTLNDVETLNVNDPSTKFNIKNLLNKKLYLKKVSLINLNNFNMETIMKQYDGFDGFKIVLANVDKPDESYTITFKNKVELDVDKKAFISSLFNENFDFTIKWHNSIQWNNYLDNEIVTTQFSNFTKFLNENIASIELENLPTEPTQQMIDNIDQLYVQKTIYQMMAKQTADSIKKSTGWYPGKNFDIKSFSNVNWGYINGDLIGRWDQNPLMMGWDHYTGIMATSGRGSDYWISEVDGQNNELHEPSSVLNVFNILGHFGSNYYEGMPFENSLASYKLPATTQNKVLGSIYNQEVVNKLQKDKTYKGMNTDASILSPTGLIGLMAMSSYLTPSQANGISYIGNNWNFFGLNINGANDGTWINAEQQAQVTKNIDTLVNDIFEMYDVFNLNHIDFDYEYPTGQQWGFKLSSYVNLVEKIRKKFNYLSVLKGRKMYVSMAGSVNMMGNWGNNLNKLADACDYMNIMTYDMGRPNKNSTGYNSQLFRLTNEEANAVNGNAPYVNLTNRTHQLLKGTERIDNIPKTSTPVNANTSQWTTNSVESWIDDLINRGVDSKKIIVGNASYMYTWNISGNKNGPLNDPDLVGAFTKGGAAPDSWDNRGIEGFIDDIYAGKIKVYFNPYVGGNHMIAENGDKYMTSDFVSSILAKREFIKKKNLAGMMVWTFNSQRILKKDANNKYDVSFISDRAKIIKNFPILAASTGIYTNQEIFDAIGPYLAPNFKDYFL